MNPAAHYARALFELVEKTPNNEAVFLHNLVSVLKRRGHGALLARIFSEYQKLELQKKRTAGRSKTSADERRTKVLLELYRKLIAS